jgi:NitT/TauT family transport system substrate-binding protein
VSIGVLNSIGQGARIRLVADRGAYGDASCTSTALVGRRGLVPRDRPVGAEDLRGRRFGMSSPSSGTAYFFDAVLDSLGLRPDEVRSTHVPSAATLEALDSGGIDFVHAIEPQLTRLLSAGHEIAVPYEKVLPGFQSGALVFGPTLLEKDRDAGRRFVGAYLRAVRQYNEGKTERNLEVLSRGMGLDRETIGRMCWPPLREDGRIHAGGLMAFQEWGRRKGFVDRVVPASRFWEAELAQAAAADLARKP